MEAVGWEQFGLAGLVAMSLGGVIAYVFKLFVGVQTDTTARALKERDDIANENIRLHNKIEDQQRETVSTLGDVARVLAEVQQMLREREMRLAMERELRERRESRQRD